MKAAVCLKPDETLAAAARLLKRDNIGCLPVCQDGKVLGMITDRDIAMRGVADDRDTKRDFTILPHAVVCRDKRSYRGNRCHSRPENGFLA
jgi:CBS domain-containing protein